MKTTSSRSPGSVPMPYLPKLRLNRTRTCSSDSGCDVVCDSPDLTAAIMEDCIQTWEVRLEGVVGQEMERAKEVTNWAKEALRHAAEDETKRQEVLENWRSQLEAIMEFTKDLIECVNNDTKEVMYDSMGLSSAHESTSTIQEEEDEDKEEEIMQLFLLSAMGQNKKGQKRGKEGNKNFMKEFISIYKKNGKSFKNSRKANKEVQTAYSKIKRQESLAKRRISLEETKLNDDFHTKDDFTFSQKMFDSVLDSTEIFSDWHWNLNEKENYENIFSEWLWNLEIEGNLKLNYYDDLEVKHDWNEFNFWKVTDPSKNVKIELDSGILADSEDDKVWTNCKFWQTTDDNENIAHSLVDNIIEEDGNKDVINFWDENTANLSILESLLDDNENRSLDETCNVVEFIWEAKDAVMSLMEMENSEERKPVCDNLGYIWKDLETNTLILDQAPKDRLQTSISNLIIPQEYESEDDDWTNWSFWNEFGTIPDILDAYDQSFKNIQRKQNDSDLNIQAIFWNISLGERRLSDVNYFESMSPHDSIKTKEAKNTPKDPVNIFKTFKHVFTVPKELSKTIIEVKQGEENHLFEDMEDVYADWASITLFDERCEKKRQIRGRKKERNSSGSNKENLPKQSLGHRRPGTPTIHTVTKTTPTKLFDFNTCWIETKVPKKERKTAHVWKNARSQKRLKNKIYAKQPRSIM